MLCGTLLLIYLNVPLLKLLTGGIITFAIALLRNIKIELNAPAMVAGALLGARLLYRVDEGLFRRITLLLVIASGVFSILTGIGLIK